MNLATHHLPAACYEIGQTVFFFFGVLFLFSVYSIFLFRFSFLVSNIFQNTDTQTHRHSHAFSLTNLHPEMGCETQLDYLVHSYTLAFAKKHTFVQRPRHLIPATTCLVCHSFIVFILSFIDIIVLNLIGKTYPFVWECDYFFPLSYYSGIYFEQ